MVGGEIVRQFWSFILAEILTLYFAAVSRHVTYLGPLSQTAERTTAVLVARRGVSGGKVR